MIKVDGKLYPETEVCVFYVEYRNLWHFRYFGRKGETWTCYFESFDQFVTFLNSHGNIDKIVVKSAIVPDSEI
jgi:hypothetical protein